MPHFPDTHPAQASLEEIAETADARAAELTDAVELREVIRKLSIEEAEVVVLHYLQGYECREIAQIVRAPISTVKYRLLTARAHLQRELGEGDLVYLNEPAGPMRQWAWLPLDQMHALESRLSMRAPGEPEEEKMERREFLRQTAASAVGLVVSEAEKDVVDERLARKVTLAFKGTALADVCERLRAETGVHLAAGPSVADEKITLFCKERPLREAMRQLSRPFGYTWVRSRTAREYRYLLEQDLRSQLLEEELRSRDRHAALLALEREMAQYRPYLDLFPDEALERARGAPPEEKKRLDILAWKGWGPVQMYFRLSPRELAALRAGQTLTFTPEPKPGELPLPPDVARGVLQSYRDWRIVRRDGQFECDTADKLPEGLPPISVPEARAKVILELHQSELGQFTINNSSAGFTTDQSSSMTWGRAIAIGMSPTVQHPQNAIANARRASDPALRPRVSIQPQCSCRRSSGLSPTQGRRTEEEVPPARCMTADVLEALYQATGLPLIADHYTRLYDPGVVSIRDQPLFEVLNRLADTMHLRWGRDETWLQFRSAGFYDDRLKEVPNRLLSRWASARQQQGALSLEDLTEIAQLAAAQLDAGRMAEGAKACWGLTEWDVARSRNLRPHLGFLARLSPAQRKEAVSAAGLSFRRLSLPQQQQLISLAETAVGDAGSLEELAGLALYVDYTVPGWWQWYAPEDRIGPGWPSFRRARVRERTREAALQAARRMDPNVDETQIVPTQGDVVFTYIRREAHALYAHRVTSGGHWGRKSAPRDP